MRDGYFVLLLYTCSAWIVLDLQKCLRWWLAVTTLLKCRSFIGWASWTLPHILEEPGLCANCCPVQSHIWPRIFGRLTFPGSKCHRQHSWIGSFKTQGERVLHEDLFWNISWIFICCCMTSAILIAEAFGCMLQKLPHLGVFPKRFVLSSSRRQIGESGLYYVFFWPHGRFDWIACRPIDRFVPVWSCG